MRLFRILLKAVKCLYYVYTNNNNTPKYRKNVSSSYVDIFTTIQCITNQMHIWLRTCAGCVIMNAGVIERTKKKLASISMGKESPFGVIMHQALSGYIMRTITASLASLSLPRSLTRSLVCTFCTPSHTTWAVRVQKYARAKRYKYYGTVFISNIPILITDSRAYSPNSLWYSVRLYCLKPHQFRILECWVDNTLDYYAFPCIQNFQTFFFIHLVNQFILIGFNWIVCLWCYCAFLCERRKKRE